MSGQTSAIKVYGCGGCGINQVKNMEIESGAIGLPIIERAYVDTSTANVPDGSDVPFYQVPGMSGAGQRRLTAHDPSRDQVIPMLKELKPSQSLNIIIFSTSGGSGSVLGPLIADELTRRGLPTVCIIVGSIISKPEAHNTLATLRTLEGLSVASGKPIVISYFQNTSSNDYPDEANLGVRETVDQKIHETLQKLATLACEKHEELDREDIYNFLDYTRMFDIPSQIVDLIVTSRDDRLEKLKGEAITVANLFKSKADPEPDLQQMYVTTGYYRRDLMELTQGKVPNFSYVTTHSLRRTRYEMLEKIEEEFRVAEEKQKNNAKSDINSQGGAFHF